ncbi:MAG: ABC transporter substrate-binding protein [Anaerostipes sp.]|nr:ABC transporter substrate-binding protein [Anaerostipes sp.]
MRKTIKRCFLFVLIMTLFLSLTSCGQKKKEKVLTLRIANWEEYIDESVIDDFQTWYEKKYHTKIKVEYSTFGTNEDLYNQLTIGDTFDIVCPSEYMIMKLMTEGKVQMFSDGFFDTGNKENYYTNGVSKYIDQVFSNETIDGKSLKKYAAGYMWGTLGFVYNPKEISEAEVSDWNVLRNKKYRKKITTKDSVRDCYFAGLSMLNQDKLEGKSGKELQALLNDTSQKSVKQVENVLTQMKDNVYSFETDSGKADMVTGKVAANLQWSGDGVYSIQQAAEDNVQLKYAVPKACTNIWFDGWCMLKNGINGNKEKQQAAEDFINFISKPENVVKNMDYIGYTSTIAGNEDMTIYNYVKSLYEDKKGNASYSLGYFFSGKEEDKRYVLQTTKKQLNGELFAMYPTKEVINRAVVMEYFPKDADKRIRQMWTNIRCFSIK